MNWRLIDTGPLPGPENMAIDEALLSCFDPDTSPPVLRLYGWNPPALSLGRFQDARAVLDLDCCSADNIPVVRRITGGGVIYHADELTYSIVCAPHHLPRAATVKESFRILTAFLLHWYCSLGLPALYAIEASTDAFGLGEPTPFCFAGRESFDILINGKKIGGNAQRRLKNAIFQHGSIPLHDRVAQGVRYLRVQPGEMAGSVAALADFGVEIRVDELKERILAAFSAALESGYTSCRLTENETRLASDLSGAKYAAESWNLGGTTL